MSKIMAAIVTAICFILEGKVGNFFGNGVENEGGS
jgi:hypothetical protein